ncbi:hypothetical protein, conserved [Leishmania tarentolae]|uniref:Uncharacterized protein n=1 Tax=Leishmania tarentolae TaxID=5689 RepID=A0A640KWF6_LEITA|nr:hypothetical protein, conserved [Leishmania tarentolae]
MKADSATMMQVDFVLYRFVSGVPTFTGLFAEDAEGRHIPDVASFQCCWARTPRTKSSSSDTSALHCADGATDNIYFKALGDDMALTLEKVTHELILNADQEVITFAIRPSLYSGAGRLPIVAKGALDPRPYFGKPMKNYAIKLRDAAGEVTGKLLFSLRAHEVDEEELRVRRRNTSVSTTMMSPPRSSPDRSKMQTGHDSLHNQWLKTPPRSSPDRSKMQTGHDSLHNQWLKTPPRSEGLAQVHSHVLESQETLLHLRQDRSPQHPQSRGEGSQPSQHDTPILKVVDIQLERIMIKTESIDIDHPAPLLLGGDYSIKIRYGSYNYRTAQAVCCNPKEVVFHAQQTRITFQPAGSTEKLRLSLWEGKRQVAGFSLDPAKFKCDAGEWKEYAIPFRYHPTGQRAALDVRVCRVGIDRGDAPSRRESPPRTAVPNASPAPSTLGVVAPAASRAVPHQLTRQADPLDMCADNGARGQTPLKISPPPKQYGTVKFVAQDAPRVHTRLSSSPHRGLPSRPVSGTAASGWTSPPDTTNRGSTPLRVCEASGVRGGWERTPMGERPPQLTSNLADLPADRRAPDAHEVYIAEVLSRLERQQRAPRQQTSLVEEWAGWRRERERSRSNSVASMNLRSASVRSTASQAGSVTSVVSRRALTPRPTKSNADNSFIMPCTPDTSAIRRRSSHRSPTPRNPFN